MSQISQLFGRDAEAVIKLIQDFLDWFIGGLTGFFSNAIRWGI